MIVWIAFSALGLLVLAVIKYGPTEEGKRLAKAQEQSDPWQRYLTLAGDMDPNSWAMVLSRESESQAQWATAAYEALQGSLAAHNTKAISYVCERYPDRNSLKSFVQDYCPSITVRALDALLAKSQKDASNQAEPLPTKEALIAAAKKQGAQYVAEADYGTARWVFPSLEARKRFEGESNPMRTAIVER